MRHHWSRSCESLKRVYTSSTARCAAYGPCRDLHRPSSKTAWRNGGGCCGRPRRRGARCFSGSCVAGSPSSHGNPVTGEVDGYDFEAPTRFDKLFTGIAVERPVGVDEGPLGSEGIGPEDTSMVTTGGCSKGVSRKRGGVPNGIRTRVLALKGPRPRPLDDGDERRANYSPSSYHACNYGDSSGR